MKFIELLREGDRMGDVFLCKYKQGAVTKNGKPYENLILQDKTGTIDAKIWDPNSQGIGDFEVLDYIHVTGDVTSFNGAMQVSVKRVRKVQEGEYDPADYLPVSDQNLDVMYQELYGYLESVQNPWLKQLASRFFIENERFITRFRTHSAAKSVHHGFVGGLLEHTLSVVKLCDYYTQAYPLLNRDLLLTAAMFHDIGKLEELSEFPENDYTDDGQLLGHIVIATEWVGSEMRRIPGFPRKLASELKHCILSHHGELEYGSPKKPALPEAVALSFADNTDAKMQTMKEALCSVPEGNTEWTDYNRLFESRIRRASS